MASVLNKIYWGVKLGLLGTNKTPEGDLVCCLWVTKKCLESRCDYYFICHQCYLECVEAL